MTFEEYYKEELDMSNCGVTVTSELYDILKEVFEAGQKSKTCNCKPNKIGAVNIVSYKYSKCIDCIHAHMDSSGNTNCGFIDCVSEEDKKYSDDVAFESYMSCYECYQQLSILEFEKLSHVKI